MVDGAVLEVADALRDEVDDALVHEREPDGAIDDLAVETCPQPRRASGVAKAQRFGLPDLAVDAWVAELAPAEGAVAGEEDREEVDG